MKNITFLFVIAVLFSSCEKNELEPRTVNPPDSTFIHISQYSHYLSECLYPYVYLIADASSLITDTTTIQWFPGGQTNPVIEIFQPIDYELYVYSVSDTDTFHISVEMCEPLEIPSVPMVYVPSGFSPDQSGVNDYFRPVANSLVESVFLQIRDIDGIVLYEEQSDPNNNYTGWDGKYNGSQMPSGFYLYYINYSTLTTENNILTGSLELIR